MQNRRLLVALVALPLGLVACRTTDHNTTKQDAGGNYVTTSKYESMQRAEFVDSIEAGLRDYDNLFAKLRTRANELGGDALKEFANCESKLAEQRTAVVNQLAIAKSSLNDSWPKERAKTVEEYEELREDFAEAEKDVLDA